jgi:hypothetical protein
MDLPKPENPVQEDMLAALSDDSMTPQEKADYFKGPWDFSYNQKFADRLSELLKQKNLDDRLTSPGVYTIGEEVIHDGEAEEMSVDPLIWVPGQDEEEQE